MRPNDSASVAKQVHGNDTNPAYSVTSESDGGRRQTAAMGAAQAMEQSDGRSTKRPNDDDKSIGI